ncbi:MAG: phosphoadenylyl-sulfate reductase [Candidatus Eiseniibacteriota bacterium]
MPDASGSLDIAAARAEALQARLGRLDALHLLRVAIRNEFPGRIALVSSFGADAAVLLHLVAQVDPATPVLFLETGQHFAVTRAYRQALAEHIGLTDVRDITPDAAALAAQDPARDLWQRDPDACCHLRKVVPLSRALDGLDAWITGRKRFQSAGRAALPALEAEDGRVKINPLWNWDVEDIDAYYAAHALPRHPLVAQGYPSIGCRPCTRAVAEGEDARAGRWAGTGKTECGIHSGLAR